MKDSRLKSHDFVVPILITKKVNVKSAHSIQAHYFSNKIYVCLVKKCEIKNSFQTNRFKLKLLAQFAYKILIQLISF